MKAREALKILGVTQQTLYNWTKSGKVKVRAKLSAHLNEYDDDSVYALVGIRKERKRKNVGYARVSTQSQKEQLKAQSQRIYESCASRGMRLDEVLEDVKSGMSEERLGFQKLMQSVIKGEVEAVIIENRDRLVRFGYGIIESVFRYFGTKIVVLNDAIDNRSYEQELTDDLISIIHYFTMKSYSHRRKLNRLRKEIERGETDALVEDK